MEGGSLLLVFFPYCAPGALSVMVFEGWLIKKHMETHHQYNEIKTSVFKNIEFKIVYCFYYYALSCIVKIKNIKKTFVGVKKSYKRNKIKNSDIN